MCPAVFGICIARDVMYWPLSRNNPASILDRGWGKVMLVWRLRWRTKLMWRLITKLQASRKLSWNASTRSKESHTSQNQVAPPPKPLLHSGLLSYIRGSTSLAQQIRLSRPSTCSSGNKFAMLRIILWIFFIYIYMNYLFFNEQFLRKIKRINVWMNILNKILNWILN